MAIPAWALMAGGVMEAPRVANNWANLFRSINEMRSDNNSNDALAQMEQFRSSSGASGYKLPEGYYSPETRVKLEDLRREKLHSLLRSEAAPVQSESTRLLNMARTDPYVGSEEGRRDFAERPNFWLGGTDTGSVSGGKGTVPESSGNPYESQALQQFAGENANVLNAFRASGGDRMAGANLVVDKDLAKGFQDVSAGIENYNQERTAEGVRVADKKLADYYANTPYDPAQHATWMEGAARTGAPVKDVLDLSQHLMDRNKDRPVRYEDVKVQNGPNSTVERVWYNGYGQPITNFSTQSINNPSDREQGLVPPRGGGGGGRKDQIAVVSFPGPDGTPITREVQMGPNGTFNEAVVARAVAEAKQGTPGYHVTIPQIDSKGNTKFVTYGTKPGKASRRERFAPPGGGGTAAPAAADPLGIRR